MNKRNEKAIENCIKALDKLENFIAISNENNTEIVRAGVIQAFEYNFEAFWKIFQKIAGEEGITANSPKTAFSAAFQMGLIQDERTWLAILTDRNLTTHTYHEDLANQIFKRIKNQYLNEFKIALTRVSRSQ